jgi:short-subunit dehydrogenase
MEKSSAQRRPLVLITGASSGIGAAAVEVFAAAGYDVVLAARRQALLDEVVAQVRARHPEARLLPAVCDVASDASVAALFEAVAAQFGYLDVLVNNAGYGCYGGVEDLPLDAYRANLETNFFGVLRCAKAALPLLRQAARASRRRWGAAIVMVSSFVGRRALPMFSSYCATKFALEALSESLRVELFDERISVSVVNPGVTRTEFVASAKGTRPSNFVPMESGMSAAAVARVLLQAVRRPRRNRFLTWAGKTGVVWQWLAPGLVDRILVRMWRQARRKTDAQPR